MPNFMLLPPVCKDLTVWLQAVNRIIKKIWNLLVRWCRCLAPNCSMTRRCICQYGQSVPGDLTRSWWPGTVWRKPVGDLMREVVLADCGIAVEDLPAPTPCSCHHNQWLLLVPGSRRCPPYFWHYQRLLNGASWTWASEPRWTLQ